MTDIKQKIIEKLHDQALAQLGSDTKPSPPVDDPCPQCARGGVCNIVECGRKQSSELMWMYGSPTIEPSPTVDSIPKRLRDRHDGLYGKGSSPSVMTEAADAIEQLVQERNEAVDKALRFDIVMTEAADAIEQLVQERNRLAAEVASYKTSDWIVDAERYRWLREQLFIVSDGLDSAIDAAMKEKK